MSIESGKAKAAKLRADMERYAAGRRATKVNELNKMVDAGDRSARATLRKMRDQYHAGPKTKLGEAWNPKGKAHAKGNSNKHNQIMKGARALRNQGNGV